MPWWFPLLVLVSSYAIGQLLRPRIKVTAPQPSGLGEFQFPTSEEGRAIPVVFGRCYVKGTNTLWYGDLKTTAVTRDDQTLGYKYELGVHHGVCWGPVDNLHQITIDDKPLPSGIMSLDSSHNTILCGQGTVPPWFTATIPAVTYDSPMALAQAARTAMQAVSAGDWQVGFGFDVIAGYNDVLRWGLYDGFTYDLREITVAPGRYRTGESLAAYLTTRLDAALNATVLVEYTSGRFRIKLTASSTFIGIMVYGDAADGMRARTILPTLGFNMANKGSPYAFAAPWSVGSDVQVYRDRFVIAFPSANGKLRLSDSGFTAAGIMGLPVGVDLTVGVLVGTQPVELSGATYNYTTDLARVDINQPDLFGGELEGGGISGTLMFYYGTQTQEHDAYLVSKFGGPVPTYRGLCHCVQYRTYVGTSNFPKPFGFIVDRYPNTLGAVGGHEAIGTDANPACMVYDMLTNTVWGCGIPAAMVDTDAFLAASETLFTDGMGLSMMLDGGNDASDILLDIMRHIDGVLYDDPSTGKLTIMLARDGYDIGTLPVVDTSVASSVSMTRVSYDDTRNVVRIRYMSAADNFTERIVQAMDLANIQARGGDQAIEEYPFIGVSNASTAQKVAARALKQVAFPLAIFSITMNRAAWALRPGSLFKLNWPEHGITNMACRVTRSASGEMTDGSIALEAVQDIFGVSWFAYAPPSTTLWVDPGGLPSLLADQVMMEATYAMLLGEGSLIATLGAAGVGPPTQGYDVHTDPAGGVAFRQTARVTRVTPAALLNMAMTTGTLTFTADPDPRDIDNDPFLDVAVQSISDAEFDEGKNLLMIDNEIVAYREFNLNPDGTYTIDGLARGAHDTAPAAHTNGARVWFLSAGFGLTRTAPDYAVGATVTAKLLPFNQRGGRSIGEAPTLSLTTTGRSTRPLCPTDLRVNTLPYPDNVNGTVVVTWEHRNRKLPWTYSDSGLTATAEAGTVYRVKLFNEVGTLVHTSADLANTVKTYTWVQATEISDSGLGRLNGIVTAQVWAVISASALLSAFAASDTFDCAGWGMLWGDWYGGAAG